MLEELGRPGLGRARSSSQFEAVRRACVAYKARIVAEDEREAGRRVLLNLGHTVAHALEAARGMRGLTHGEAVGFGLVHACALAQEMGLLAEELDRRVAELLSRLSFPRLRPPFDLETLLGFMRGDKKRRRGRLVFVLPSEEGPQVREAPPARVLAAAHERWLDTLGSLGLLAG